MKRVMKMFALEKGVTLIFNNLHVPWQLMKVSVVFFLLDLNMLMFLAWASFQIFVTQKRLKHYIASIFFVKKKVHNFENNF